MAFSSVRYKGKAATHFVISSLLVTFVCCKSYTLSGLNGWLPSPEDPIGYQRDLVWNIEVPLGLRVVLAFVEFDIEQCGSLYSNCGPSVTVNADDIELGTFCGRRESSYGPKDIIRSPSNNLKVHFISHYHSQNVEFKAYYYAEDIDECLDQNGGCEHLCHNVYSGFYCSCSPGYTLDSDSRNCTVKRNTTLLTEDSGELDTRIVSIDEPNYHDWTIVVESGHNIALDFNAFNIIGWDACYLVYVKIYTGDEEFGSFCGDIHVSNFPTIIYSISNVMTIRYVDRTYSNDGLVQARYNITDPSSAPRCRSLQAPVNGRIIGRNSTYDQFVWFKCDYGYYMDGSMTRLCTKDGTWTGVQPHCYPPYRLMNENTGVIHLPPYLDFLALHYKLEWEIVVEMGYVIQLEFDYFAVGELRSKQKKQKQECTVSLEISEGTRVLDHLCGNNSTNNVPAAIQSSGNVMKLQYRISLWPSPDKSIARYYVQGVDCGRPEEIANGNFTNDNFTYPNTVIYSCNAFYKLLGKNERMCQANATWSGTKPHCEPVCGIPLVTPRSRSPSRILGGLSVLRGSWPWTVFLSVHSPAHGVRRAICGGSLLNNEWVVTAAHCVINPQANPRIFGHTLPLASFNVTLGLHRRSRPREYVQYRKVVEITPSPHNDPHTFDADIALLKLDPPVAFTKYIRPVCLPLNDADSGVADQGDLAVVVGWGKTSNGRPSDVLRETYVPIVSQQTCVKAYNRSYVVTDNMFCAGYQTGRFDSCDGDSGGPLMLQDERSQRYYLYGIVSWGRPGQCAARDSYGVYVNVSNFTPWIQEITNIQP